MSEKIGKTIKGGKTENAEKIDGLFSEVQEEINEDIVKEAKLKIKGLLEQRIKAQKIVKNLDRQIGDLKIQISNELG